MPNGNTNCTFCGKSRGEVKIMVQGGPPNGPIAFICDECIEKARKYAEITVPKKPVQASLKLTLSLGRGAGSC